MILSTLILLGWGLFFYSCTVSSTDSASVKSSLTLVDDRVVLETDTGIVIQLWLVKGEKIRVRVDSKDKPYQSSPFFVEKEPLGIFPQLQGEGALLGLFYIEPLVKGYGLYLLQGSKKLPLYKTQFELDGRVLLETRDVLNQEEFLGMGAVHTGLLIQSKTIDISQRAQYGTQTYLNIPWHFTTGGDSFYHNANFGDFFHFGTRAPHQVIPVSQQGTSDYYYWYQPQLKTLVQEFYEFSQAHSLLPKWAFGYIQSRYGYETQEEASEVLAEFKRRNLPLSALVLDLYWYRRMGDWSWNTKKWPSPQGFKQQLENQGVKLIGISQMYMTDDSINFERYKKNNWLVHEGLDGDTIRWKSWWSPGSIDGSMVDLWAPGVEEDLKKQYSKMHLMGFDGFWTDLGEPEESPDSAVYGSGMRKGEVHNYFNREWSRIVYESMRQNHPDVRPFNLTRSGYTGSARYNVSVWSGDVSSSFAMLEVQPSLGMNSGVSGFSYWGSDVGGFVTGKEKEGGIVLPGSGGTGLSGSSKVRLPDPELFVRWQQFGALSPVYRAHGAQSAREPWIHEGKYYDAVKEALELRYRLLPYLYSTAWQTWKLGLPMMRPLYFEHQQEPGIFEQTSTFYLGDSLLAAPILKALTPHRLRWTITLPPGNWLDFHTLQPVESGTREHRVQLNSIPLFLREGAIVPLQEGERKVLLLYPGKEPSQWVWYDDDGVSNQYLNNRGTVEQFIRLQERKILIEGTAKAQSLELRLVGLMENDKGPTQNGWSYEDGLWKKQVNLKAGSSSWDF